MPPDEFQRVWQAADAHAKLSFHPEQVLQEVQRKDRQFSAIIFWRDVREIGTCAVLLPVWIVMGWKLALPWSWYLMIPSLIGVAAYMLIDRWRHAEPPDEAPSLRNHLAAALRRVDHQIELLRSVFWWYLLPLAAPMICFFLQIGWNLRKDGWLTVIAVSSMIGFVSVLYYGLYLLNQYAVRKDLIPRREELASLIESLDATAPVTE